MTTGPITISVTAPAGWIIDGWQDFMRCVTARALRARGHGHWQVANDNADASLDHLGYPVSRVSGAVSFARKTRLARLHRLNIPSIGARSRGEGVTT